MDFIMTDQEKKDQRAFAQLCEAQFMPAAGQVDREGQIPPAHIKALAEAGYLGFGLDADYGGRGRSLVMWACLGEHLARCCPSTFVATSASSQLFGTLLSRLGTAEQKKALLPPLCAGEAVAAVAVTDTREATDDDPGRVTAVPNNGGNDVSIACKCPLASIRLRPQNCASAGATSNVNCSSL